jgi:iron complex transport system ATP-binding protein
MKELMQIKNLTVDIAGLRLLDNLSFTLWENDCLVIIGPNGAGKSTLLTALSQGMAYSGEVLIGGQNIRKLSSLQRARSIGLFAQRQEVNYGFTVEEIVRLGRYAYAAGIFAAKDPQGDSLIEEGLRLTGLLAKRHQSVLTLSGGELQRVFLAQLFAQDPQILMLDEPTNHLDIKYQKQLQGILKEWSQQKNRAIIAVIHDLSLARLYGSKLLLLSQGQLVAYGEPDAVLSKTNLFGVYDMDVHAWMAGLARPWGNITGPAS